MKSMKIALMMAIAASSAGVASAQSNTMGGMSGMSQGSMGNMKMGNMKMPAKRTSESHKLVKTHGHGKHHHSHK